MSNEELKIDDVVPEIVDRGTAAGDPTPNVPKEIKRRGRGVDLSTLDPEALKLHKKAINQKTRKKAKDAKDKTAAAYNSPAEPTKNRGSPDIGRAWHSKRAHPEHGLQDAACRGVEQSHSGEPLSVCERFAADAGINRRQTSQPFTLENPNDYPEGELSTRAELHAVMDAFWKGEPITFDQWLGRSSEFKSSAFEMSQDSWKRGFWKSSRGVDGFRAALVAYWAEAKLHTTRGAHLA